MNISSQEELERLMQKGAKGFITELTKYTQSILKENIRKNLYDVDPMTFMKKPTKKINYKRSKGIYSSVSINKTQNMGDSFENSVYFDEDVLYAHKSPKGGRGNEAYLGTYMDIHNNFVGDELIESMWIDEGTDNGLRPRYGANYVQDTINQIEDMLSGSEIEYEIGKSFNGISVERFK